MKIVTKRSFSKLKSAKRPRRDAYIRELPRNYTSIKSQGNKRTAGEYIHYQREPTHARLIYGRIDRAARAGVYIYTSRRAREKGTERAEGKGKSCLRLARNLNYRPFLAPVLPPSARIYIRRCPPPREERSRSGL